MPRATYRDIAERFTHIDGEVVSVEVSCRPRDDVFTARVILRFYAWWEHPLLLTARAAGGPWGIEADDDAERDMVIEAVGPVHAEIDVYRQATDIAFCTEHPAIWDLQPQVQVFCNSDFDAQVLTERILARKVPFIHRGNLAEHVVLPVGFEAPGSLGYFPYSIARVVREELEQMGVRLFVGPEPTPPEPKVAFTIDGDVVLVARDFLVDVPEFEHRPEYFKPR